jgi:hypothetical protein
LNKLKSTRYGQQTIRLADKHGYIKRIRDVKPQGRGNLIVMNYLTPKGKRLLKAVSSNNKKTKAKENE